MKIGKNLTATILVLIQHPVFYLNYNFSDTGFGLRLEMKPT
jgi:hypothetical protein